MQESYPTTGRDVQAVFLSGSHQVSLLIEKVDFHRGHVYKHGYATQKCYLYVVSGRQRSKYSGRSTTKQRREIQA